MKKLTKLSILFLITATVFFSCKKQTTDEETLPGEWTETATFGSNYYGNFTDSTLTVNGNTFVFEYEHPKTSMTESEKPAPDRIVERVYDASYEKFKGFKANIKCDSNNTVSGVIFNVKSDNPGNWTYYELAINNLYYSLKKVSEGSSTILKNWTPFSSLKQNSELNTVAIYTNDDGSIGINFNGETATTINDSVLPTGTIGVCCYVSYDEWSANSSIKVTYEFTDFQKNL